MTKSGNCSSTSSKGQQQPQVLAAAKAVTSSTLKPVISLFPSSHCYVIWQGYQKQNPFASLSLQLQCVLTQMQLKSVPLDMTASTNLKCSPSNDGETQDKKLNIFPRVIHLIFNPAYLCSDHLWSLGPNTQSVQVTAPVLLVQDISLADLMELEFAGLKWSCRNLPSSADPVVVIKTQSPFSLNLHSFCNIRERAYQEQPVTLQSNTSEL